MTTVTVLGSGRVGSTLAAKLAQAGDTVTVSSRDPQAARTKWTGPTVRFSTQEEALRGAEIVINATPGDSSVERLGALQASLGDAVILDVANASKRGSDGMPGGLCYPESSLGEELQAALPRARVVKSLNTMLFTVMVNPQSLSLRPTAFLSGNDEGAKVAVTALLGKLGWPAEWIEDLGDITTARGPEAMMLLVPAILRRRGMKPFALTVAS